METCTATTYCRINHTKLRQTGKGSEVICPVCGFKFNPDAPRADESAAEYNRRMIDEARRA